MGHGLGKLQRAIYGLLSGTVRARVYGNAVGGLGTNELLEELEESGVIVAEWPRKVQMAAVRRACAGLVGRGLVVGRTTPDMRSAGRWTIDWRAVAVGATDARSG